MADAWGNSWSAAWANTWGIGVAPPTPTPQPTGGSGSGVGGYKRGGAVKRQRKAERKEAVRRRVRLPEPALDMAAVLRAEIEEEDVLLLELCGT